MNASKILLATDFSPSSDTATEMAVRLARESGGTLIVLHVQELPVSFGGGEAYFGPQETEEELRQLMADAIPASAGIHVEYRILVGDAARDIVRIAEEENADMIVIGSHGRKGISRMLMGSVAEAVVRRAHCPVLTVKQSTSVPEAVSS